jgi:hypothetical protein
VVKREFGKPPPIGPPASYFQWARPDRFACHTSMARLIRCHTLAADISEIDGFLLQVNAPLGEYLAVST